MKIENLFKKTEALLLVTTLLITPFSVNAYADEIYQNQIEEYTKEYTEEYNEEEVEDDFVDILLIGNSLIYYNNMDTEIFPQMCEAAGKKVRISSITESGTTLYRIANENTSIGKKAMEALSENTYDYVMIEPSRRITPFEYTVYHAERQAALKLNGIINGIGAKTLVLAEPGINTGTIPVYTMNQDGISSETSYSLPIDRNTHSKFVENLCYDYVSDMKNAGVVKIGTAAEVLLSSFPNFNSLYREDNRHLSTRGSYLQAACIYSAVFGESIVGVNYVYSLYNQNAITAQRAAEVAVLGASETILTTEQSEINVNATLTSNSGCALNWDDPNGAQYYEIYRKLEDEIYTYIGRTEGNVCNYADKGFDGGKVYYYKIKPFYKVGDIVFSFGYTAETSVKTLAKPSKPKLTLINRKTAKITFTAVDDAQYYNIYRKRSDELNYTLIASCNQTEYTDKTMEAGNSYTYRITAVKQNGVVESNKSSRKIIFALSSPNFTLSSAKKGRATVKISAVKGATHYMIYAKVNGAKKYKLIKTTNKLKFTAKKLTSGKKYYFKVKAYNTSNTLTSSSLFRTRKIKIR